VVEVVAPVKLKTLADWIAVWLIVFISATLSTFIIDTSSVETELRWILVFRAAVMATAVTVFYASVVWLRREGSTVPQDITERLPHDPPSSVLSPKKGDPNEVDS
jgi:hypothetical protein